MDVFIILNKIARPRNLKSIRARNLKHKPKDAQIIERYSICFDVCLKNRSEQDFYQFNVRSMIYKNCMNNINKKTSKGSILKKKN